MRTSSPLRKAAALTVVGLVIAACGQKPGVRVDDGTPLAVNQPGVTTGQPATNTGTGTTPTTTNDGTQPTTSTGGGSSTTTTTTTTETGGGDTGAGGGAGGGGGGDTGGGDNGGGGGGDTGNNNNGGDNGNNNNNGGGGGTATPQGTDRTGAPADKIVIGLHAPATGAAPLPTTSFELARDTYWRYILDKGETVLGRSNVEVLFRDDKYAPESAIQVCRELAAEAFTVVGGGGTDQVQACGQFAEVSGVPYFSAGVTEAGLETNPWYFAASMTYRQQGGLLAQYIAKNPDNIPSFGPGTKVGTIITDTPNFQDALDGWLAGIQANGLEVAKLGNGEDAIFRHTKNDETWISGTAREFAEAGVDVVYFLSAPTLYLQFVNEADNAFDYNPTYVGVGVSKGLNAVLNGGCKEAGSRDDNGIFLSPLPGLDVIDQLDPTFNEAAAQFGTPNDDIALALWGLARGQHELFKRYQSVYGDDLTREDFRAFVEGGAGTVETGVYPSVTYAPGNHFGASTAHILAADCSGTEGAKAAKQYYTLRTFASGF